MSLNLRYAPNRNPLNAQLESLLWQKSEELVDL